MKVGKFPPGSNPAMYARRPVDFRTYPLEQLERSISWWRRETLQALAKYRESRSPRDLAHMRTCLFWVREHQARRRAALSMEAA